MISSLAPRPCPDADGEATGHTQACRAAALGLWAAIIRLPVNQIAFFVIAGAGVGAGLSLRLVDAEVTVPKVPPVGSWKTYPRFLIMFAIPYVAADILISPSTDKVSALRLLATVGVYTAFPALYWVAEAIDKRRALRRG